MFFYMDSENDMISITSQDDFDEAMDCMQDSNMLKLMIEVTIEAARERFAQMNA
jgi:hypothetical protein